MHEDRYGLPLSTASTAARDAYVEGVDCILAGIAGWEDALSRALEADPRFALAHVAQARGLFIAAQVPQARDAARRARELAAGLTPREQAHVDVLALAIEGKAPDALAATREHVKAFPRDAMALAPVTGVFGLIGFSGRHDREEELYALLAGLAPHYGDDWWYRFVHAFAACESGRLDEAEPLAVRSLEGNPRCAHGAHVYTHVLYEKGEPERAARHLDAFLPSMAREGVMHCHLSWHAALLALELGRVERAWEIYRANVHPGGAWGPPLNVATDGPSFLWRSELAGESRRPDLWREVHVYVARSFPKAGIAFADVHRAIACAAMGDGDGLARLAGELRERLQSGRAPAGEVTGWIAEGFDAYGRGDWDGAIAALARSLPHAVRIGGSRAQRDIVEHTLLAACLQAGRADTAKRVVAQHTGRHPAILVAGLKTR
jgi:tetratricopeptide (TPR) repeat protein